MRLSIPFIDLSSGRNANDQKMKGNYQITSKEGKAGREKYYYREHEKILAAEILSVKKKILDKMIEE